MPFCGIAALHYAWRLRVVGKAWWSEGEMATQPRKLRRLREVQGKLRVQLEQLRHEYRARGA
jgi:hypothetical protein